MSPPHPLTLGTGSRGAGQGEHREAQQSPTLEPGHGSAESGWGGTSPTL